MIYKPLYIYTTSWVVPKLRGTKSIWKKVVLLLAVHENYKAIRVNRARKWLYKKPKELQDVEAPRLLHNALLHISNAMFKLESLIIPISYKIRNFVYYSNIIYLYKINKIRQFESAYDFLGKCWQLRRTGIL